MYLVFVILACLSCFDKPHLVPEHKGVDFTEKLEELSSKFSRGQEAGNQRVYLYIKEELESKEASTLACLNLLRHQLEEGGSTLLHFLVCKDNAKAFRFVLEHAIKNFRPEVSRLLHQTDKIGKSVVALSFAAAPLCLAQLAELAGSTRDLIEVDTLERQVNARLFNEERGEYFDFNVLSSLLKIPSLVAFSHIPNGVELCFRNIEFLRELMGEERFHQCFMKKTKDLFKLLYTFVSFSDAMVDGVCAERYFFDNFGRGVSQQDLYEAVVESKENLFDIVILSRNWNMLEFLLERLVGLLGSDDHFCVKRRVEWAAAKEAGLKRELEEIVGDTKFPSLNDYFSEQGIWEAIGLEVPKRGIDKTVLIYEVEETKEMLRSLAENVKLKDLSDREVVDALAKLEEKVLAHEMPHTSRSAERVLLPLNTSLPTSGRGVQETTI